MNLSFYELLGDAEDINREMEKYKAITKVDIKKGCEINSNQNQLLLIKNQR